MAIAVGVHEVVLSWASHPQAHMAQFVNKRKVVGSSVKSGGKRSWFSLSTLKFAGWPKLHTQISTALSVHFWDPSQWDKMCFEYPRVIFHWTNGSKFSNLLTVRADGAGPPPPYGQPDCKIYVFYESPKHSPKLPFSFNCITLGKKYFMESTRGCRAAASTFLSFIRL